MDSHISVSNGTGRETYTIPSHIVEFAEFASEDHSIATVLQGFLLEKGACYNSSPAF